MFKHRLNNWVQKTRVWSLGQEDPLEKEMATHPSILAWRISWTEEPGRFMGLQRVRHDWATNTSLLFTKKDSFRFWDYTVSERIFLFWLCTACGIKVPRPGIKPWPFALEARSLNHWTSREVPRTFLRNFKIWRSIKTLVVVVVPVMSNFLQPHELQHTRLPCPSPSPRACLNSCPSSWWYHPTISSSVDPFSSTFNLFQHQGLFQWVGSLHQVTKVLELQLQHQCFQWLFKVDFL